VEREGQIEVRNSTTRRHIYGSFLHHVPEHKSIDSLDDFQIFGPILLNPKL
jgi:hypothetical protein